MDSIILKYTTTLGETYTVIATIDAFTSNIRDWLEHDERVVSYNYEYMNSELNK